MSDETRDELRLALVLNGGVSLAIWISGVLAEVDALRRCNQRARAGGPSGDGDSSVAIYAALTSALGLDVCVDVIAGTSAGGLNGALLATAIAADEPYAGIEQLWVTLGDLASLLDRTKHPASLLRGEQMLYETLAARLLQISAGSQATDGDAGEQPGDARAAQRRVRLILTGTDIAGVSRDTKDSFGGTLTITDHRLHARFAHVGDSGEHSSPPGWAELLPDAEPDGSDSREKAIQAVARAARTTSSFPFAFASSELQLSDTASAGQNSVLGDAYTTIDGRNVAAAMRESPFKAAPLRRWAMDGGVLDNSPISSVLDTMTGLSATRPIQRAVVFVVPYTDDPAVNPGDEPGIAQIINTVLNMPRDVGYVDHLEEVERDLARRAGDRGTVDRLLALDPSVLEAVADEAYTAFWKLRAVTSIWSLLNTHHAVLTPPLQAGVALPGQALSAELAELARNEGVQWLPAYDAPTSTLWSDLLTAGADWRWGGAPAERIALRIADWIMGAREALDQESPLRTDLAALQARLHGAVGAYRSSDILRVEAESTAVSEAAGPRGLLAREQITRISSDCWTTDRKDAARALLAAVCEVLIKAYALSLPQEAARYIEIEGADEHTQPEQLARRLLMADIVWRSLRGELSDEHQASTRYEFLRLNAAAPVPFQTLHNTSDDPATFQPRANGRPGQKLFGMQLGHFAGFVRSSWRVNDFLWGRLDGVARIADLLIAPARLTRHPVTYETMSQIPGLRHPLPSKRKTYLNPGNPAELEEWRSCIQDSLALAMLNDELNGLEAAMKTDTSKRAFADAADLGVSLSQTEPQARFNAYAALLAQESPNDIKQRVQAELHSDGGALLTTEALEVAVALLEGRNGPLKVIGRLLDAPALVANEYVVIRARAHRIWHALAEHVGHIRARDN
jgi:patatin-related protein